MLTAKEIAAKLPADKWESDISVFAYRTMQTRIVVSVETNASFEALAFAGDEDSDRSNDEFIIDLQPIFDHLSPNDELLLIEALLRRLIHWETGADLTAANRANIKRDPIASQLIEQMRLELAEAKQVASLQ